MCPGTLAIASAAASAASQIGGGIASANAAKYQGAVAANNSLIAGQNARYAASAASADTTQAGLRARAQDAGVKAGAAANGVDVDSGSAANVEASQRELGDLDTATVANRAARQTYGYQVASIGDQAQSKLDNAEAPTDVLGGFLGAAGTVTGALAKLPAGSGGQASASQINNEIGSIPTNIDTSQFPPSLISGPPSLPSAYSYMDTNGNGASVEDLGL